MRLRLSARLVVWIVCLATAGGLLAQQPPAPQAENPAVLNKRIAVLIAQLGGKDMKGQMLARSASRELGKIGKPALPALLEAAKDKNPNVRWWALGSLAAIGDPAAIETFLACLGDPNETVRCVAVYNSRGFISDERIRAALFAMTPTAGPEVRKWLLRDFTECKCAQAVPVLKDGLKNADPQARADFLNTLTLLDKAGSFDLVKGVLASDPDERVRASAVISLDNLVPSAPPVPGHFVALLISALDDASAKVQCAAVLRLYKLTGQKFLFSPSSPAAERAKAIAQWKDWWAKAAPTFPN